jgi:hypothetical protein
VLDLREGGLQALADYVLAESLQAAGPASIQLRHTHSLSLQLYLFRSTHSLINMEGSMSLDVHSCTHCLRPRNPHSPPPFWPTMFWPRASKPPDRPLFTSGTHTYSHSSFIYSHLRYLPNRSPCLGLFWIHLPKAIVSAYGFLVSSVADP